MSLANKISILRILLVPVFIGLLVYYVPGEEYLRFIALAIFLIAVVTDAVDGYLARARKEQSELGSILDPIADKLLLLSAFICFSFVQNLPTELRLPPWVLIIIISRDVIIILGSTIIYVLTGKLKVIPSKTGKLTTFLQMTTIVWLLLMLPYSKIVWIIMIIFTVISGIGYIVRGNRLLNQEGPE